MIHIGTAIAVVLGLAGGLANQPAAEERTLRWSMAKQVGGIDPHLGGNGPAGALIRQMYEGLTRLDDDRVPLPQLARGWSLDETGLTWRFFLRSGVRFHDGRRLRADDVVYSIRRAMAQLSPDQIDLRHLSDVSASNDLVIRIDTVRPDALLPARLASIMIVSHDWVIEQERAAAAWSSGPPREVDVSIWRGMSRANGTGPYKLTDHIPGKATSLVASPTYWGREPDDGPAFKRLEFLPLEEIEARMTALDEGSVDVVLDPLIDVLKSPAGPIAVRGIRGGQANSLLLGFDLASGDVDGDDVEGANPFADRRVREAISLAIDTEAIRNVILQRRSRTAGMPVAPNVFGWSQSKDSWPGIDIEKASELMSDAGYSDGFTTTLHCPQEGYLGHGAFCRAIVAMLALIDIDVGVRRWPMDQHLASLREGEPSFFLLPWSTSTLDSRQALEALYHTADGTFGHANYTGFSNAELDDLIQQLSEAFDRQTAADLLTDAWDRAIEHLVYIPMHHETGTWLARRAFIVEPDGAGFPAFNNSDVISPQADPEPGDFPPTGP